MRQNPHVRICGGPGSATTLVYPTVAGPGRRRADADFTGRGDRVRYRLEVDDGVTAVTVTARLLFQTIGYRWARNLAELRRVRDQSICRLLPRRTPTVPS